MASKPPDKEDIFSPEWVKHNEWMQEANEKARKESQPSTMRMFINFHNGIPVPKLRKKWDEYANWKKRQDENLAIFHAMLSEKGIRAGTGSVGEAHKGWGNGKQRG